MVHLLILFRASPRMAQLNYKKIAANMLKVYQTSGSVQMVLDHPDLGPVRRDAVGMYRLMQNFIAQLSPLELFSFAERALDIRDQPVSEKTSDKDSVAAALVAHVFGHHPNNSALMERVLKTCVLSSKFPSTSLALWMENPHYQQKIKQYWRESTAEQALCCEENLLRYLLLYDFRLDLHTFVEFIPLISPTETNIAQVYRKLVNYKLRIPQNASAAVVLNALEDQQTICPNNTILEVITQRFFSSLPLKDQQAYQHQRNAQMRERLTDIIATHPFHPSIKRKM